MSAVHPGWSTAAPPARSLFTISIRPASAASISAVSPNRLRALTDARPVSNTSTVAALPSRAAMTRPDSRRDRRRSDRRRAQAWRARRPPGRWRPPAGSLRAVAALGQEAPAAGVRCKGRARATCDDQWAWSGMLRSIRKRRKKVARRRFGDGFRRQTAQARDLGRHVRDVRRLVALAAKRHRREIGGVGLDQHPVEWNSTRHVLEVRAFRNVTMPENEM